ncbi:unnamed protein product [Ophioblennius macclurei]
MDRPARKTKSVNYCEAKDFDDDEDFAFVKAPPSKKPKEDTKREQKQPPSKSISQENSSQSSQCQKNRKPLDEKLLERDLEAAITLSMLNHTPEEQQTHTNEEAVAVLPLGESPEPPSLLRSNVSVDSNVLGLDKITSENHKKARKTTEEPKKTDEDDDYEPKLTPDSESDEDFSEAEESEDEEFTVTKSSKSKKKEKVTKSEKSKTSPAASKAKRPSKPSKPKSAATSAPIRSPPAAKPAAKRPVSSSAVSTPKVSASASSGGSKVPKWNPPAQIGKSPPSSCQRPAGRSPAQGLRLGLSRLVRVKPLHPGVASH